MKIALVAQGYSNREFILDWFEEDFDEVWGVNSAAAVFQCTLAFRMDDARVMELAGDDPRYPVVTSEGLQRKNERFSRLVDCPVIVSDINCSIDLGKKERFPIEEFIHRFKGYFEDTPGKFFIEGSLPYMIGYAIMWAATNRPDEPLELFLYGFDYTYDNTNIQEQGLSSAAYWLCIARAEGATVKIAKSSSLLGNYKRANLNEAAGALIPGRGIFYGYFEEPHLQAEVQENDDG
mgnify:FL=1|tara:strand:+ start:331 stop:1035 length:705 start_codon:yes stop_codon:yes gene_type:complete